MRKLYILGLVALAAVIIGLAWAEQMTFSTYYPAPAGVYNQMVTRCLGVGDQTGDGLNYADAPDPSILAQENDLWVAGRVGIGTTDTSYYRLNIEDATHSTLRPKWTDTTGRGECTFWQNADFYGSVGAFGSMYVDPLVREGLGLTSGVDNNGFIFFRTKTGNTLRDRMRIVNNGNVGIGTTQPNEKLEVAGKIRLEGNSYSLIYNDVDAGREALGLRAKSDAFDGTPPAHDGAGINLYGNGDSAHPGKIKFFAGGDTRMTIHPTGLITGSFGNIHSPSDVRLKKDITTIPNALEKISALRGVNYRWKSSSEDQSLRMGMIAQEVEKVVPEVVHTADDEMKTKAVEYQYMVALLVEAIKELNEKNKELERKIGK